jgi:hypothetical protein
MNMYRAKHNRWEVGQTVFRKGDMLEAYPVGDGKIRITLRVSGRSVYHELAELDDFVFNTELMRPKHTPNGIEWVPVG